MMKIRIIEFDGLKPAPAYTDFSSVFISSALSGEQRKTALKHERAHIWLQHQVRRANLAEEIGHALDARLWNIAADLEIAQHIYNQRDVDAIELPRSLLAGAIRKSHCVQYPDCEFAEEYYRALLQDPLQACANSHDGEASDAAANDDSTSSAQIGNLSDLLQEAKSLSDQTEQADISESSEKQAQKSVEGFLPPKPSLAALIDMHIGRTIRARVRSYRRHSRIASMDFLKKGATTKQKAPKITIYVDRSGSFSPDKTASSVQKMHECLRKYRGRIDCDVIYFADQLMRADPGQGCGGTNYQPVVDQICADTAEIALIITDSDSADGVSVPDQLPPVVIVPIGCSVTDIGRRLSATHAS